MTGDRIELVAATGIAFCGVLAVAGTILVAVQGGRATGELSALAGACLGYLAGVLVRRRNGH